MNRVFKNVFNKTTGEYVVASEHARGHSKSQKLMTGCIAAALLIGSISFTHASAVLENTVVKVSIAENGTIGSGHANNLGMLYDPNETGSFSSSKDYLTPGTPWQMFSVSTNETGIQRNQNDNSDGLYFENDFTTTTSTQQQIIDNSLGQQTATWSGEYKLGDTVYYTIDHEYSVDNTLHGIAIETKITAQQNLTDVKFATAIDPDPDGLVPPSTPGQSYYVTQNIRGDDSKEGYTENNWIYAIGPETQNILGIYSKSEYEHNTSVLNPWSTNPDLYLQGTDNNELGDFAIGMGFYIGDLKAQDYAVIDYAYLFGFPNTSPTNPPVNPPAEAWSNIDLAQSYYQSTKLNGSTTYLPELGVNVRPIFEGGTLQIDHGSESRFYANDFTMNELGGKIDANATESRFKGVFSNTEGVTQAGDFYILDQTNQNGKVTFEGKNTYNGKTIIENATLALALGGDLKYSSGVHLNHSDAVFDVSQVTAKATQIQDLSSTAGTVYTGNTVLTAGTANNTTFAGQLPVRVAITKLVQVRSTSLGKVKTLQG